MTQPRATKDIEKMVEATAKAMALAECQSAWKRDPISASNRDPLLAC